MNGTLVYDLVKNDPRLCYAEYYALECDCFPAEPNSEALFREASLRDYWTARIGGALAGYAGVARFPDRMNIGRLEVHAGYRNAGIGGALIDAALGLAERENVPCVTLSVRVNNPAAHRLYVRKGFTEYGRKYRYAAAVGEVPEAPAAALVKAGEGIGHQYPAVFVRDGREIGSGVFSAEVGGCKDFMLADPAGDILSALAAVRARLKPGAARLYIVTEDTETAKALKALPFAAETAFINMKRISGKD